MDRADGSVSHARCRFRTPKVELAFVVLPILSHYLSHYLIHFVLDALARGRRVVFVARGTYCSQSLEVRAGDAFEMASRAGAFCG